MDVIVSSDDHHRPHHGLAGRPGRSAWPRGQPINPKYAAKAVRQGDLDAWSSGPTSRERWGYKKVFHAVSRLDRPAERAGPGDDGKKVIERAVTESITQLELMESKSIAFPAIGTGLRGDHAPTDVATAFAKVSRLSRWATSAT